MANKIFLAAVVAILSLAACKKETDDFTMPELGDYYPLQVGKYITYQCDSLRYGNSGSLTGTTYTYQVKYEVDAAVTDNNGRPAYRIYRYIRNSNAGAWVKDNTYLALNDGASVELVENNFRYIKLKRPFTGGFSWKGNAYINTSSAYSDFRYLDNWDYTYDSVNAPLTLGALTVDNTIKVAQRDEVIGNPGDPNSYSEINYGAEYYAKGIGLVYRRLYHSEYQPPTDGGTGKYASGSFGVTFTMIDHN
ncbi:MAG: hypothetical protein RL172_414 [Bacteroidota bacterium]|jgi:hypothetical protein